MPAAPLSRRLRLGVAAVVVVLVLATGALIGAIRYGATAVEPGGGYLQSIRATGRPVWVGQYLRNGSAVPVVLRAWQPRGLTNLKVLEARVVPVDRGGVSMLTEPLDSTLQAAIDGSSPVDGFVLPPTREQEYEIVVRVQRVEPGRAAVLHGGATVYEALGFTQGAVDDGVSCIRAPGGGGCPRP